MSKMKYRKVVFWNTKEKLYYFVASFLKFTTITVWD